MYFGSVRFFKHLIYTVVIGFVAVAVFLAVLFGVLYGREKAKNGENSAVNVSADKTEDDILEENIPLDQYYLRMAAEGYSANDIMEFLKENETESVDNFVNGYITENPDKFNVSDGNEDISLEAGQKQQDGVIEYTELYPQLYADPPTESTVADKTIYLTFDDGPSANTMDILTILDKYNIKATFFMSGGESDETVRYMKEVAERGHTIGIHSISHDYEEIYSSVESFLEDMDNTYMSVYNATGVKPQIMRFAGGSINNYNRLIYPQLIAEVTRRGFVYYDWNVSGEDASPNATWTSIYNNILNGVNENTAGRAIVLLHDSEDKQTTVTTVEDIIKVLLDEGYSFDALDNSVKPINFSYVD